MRFSELLEIHNSSRSEQSHPEILGDGYLMRENEIYSRMRRRALDLGALLKEASLEYLLLPLNQLDRILASKQIPYIPSARLMADIENQQPGIFDLQQMPIPGSYQMHESAHFIAENILSRVSATSQNEKVLKSILSESFANTVDALASVEVENELHRVFLGLNCYMMSTEANRKLIRQVRTELGDSFTIRFIFLSYVFSNFLKDSLPAPEIEMLISIYGERNDLTSSSAKETLESCLELSRIGQNLDPLFRTQTASNYFQLQGFRGEIYDLLHFDFSELLERDDFASAVDALVDELTPEPS